MKLKMLIIFLLLITIIFPVENIFAFSEQILITQAASMNDVIFDGKWTNYLEWKQSSQNAIAYDDGTIIYLRTAHYENFIYVFIDPINDQTLDKSSDKATICIDGKNEKNSTPDKNDFCFAVGLGQNQGRIFQGDSVTQSNGHFKRIFTINDYIAISSSSDKNDRYTNTPHPSYEFKIPIDIIERSNNYGFYMSVYDASSNTFYSWPKELHRKNLFEIPSPKNWGNMISPDKSLPEFSTPFMIFLFFVSTIILIQNRTKKVNSNLIGL